MQNPNLANNPSTPKSQFFTLTLLFCIISCIFIYYIYTEKILFGSEIGNWTYPYFKEATPISIWIPITAIGLLAILAFIGSRAIYSHEKIWVTFTFLIIVVLQILLHSVYPISLGDMVESDVANSFFKPAVLYRPAEVLMDYEKISLSLSYHARTNMPGKILFFQLLMLLTNSSFWMGYWIIVISSLGSIILYRICYILFSDRWIGYLGMVFYALIPSKLCFFPVLNTITPVFILLSFQLFLEFFYSKRPVYFWLLGISLYAMFLFEPSPFITGLIFIFAISIMIQQKRISPVYFFKMLFIPILSFFALHWFFFSVLNFDIFRTFNFMLVDAVDFNIRDNRGYSIWLGENLKEFFYGAGLPVMMFFVYGIFDIINDWRAIFKNPFQWMPINAYLIGLFLTMSVLSILGINRGETTRLWIYLAAFFQIPAAYYLAQKPKDPLIFFTISAILVFQTLISLSKVSFISL